MNYTRFTFLLGLIMCSQLLLAQTRTPMISIESTSHDFGKIKESDGPASWKFVFTNTGGVPLVISNVTASCGCTSPSWSKEPVLPGATGYISAIYDPRDRPGIFEKTITVTSNSEPSVMVLKISGDVIPRGNLVDQSFKAQVGDLKMKTGHIGFGEVFAGSPRTIESPIVNSGTAPLKLEFANVPRHLVVLAKPATLRPGEMGTIAVTYNSGAQKTWGYSTDRVGILLNGKALPGNNLTISATLSEDFSKLTEKELADAPAISFEKDTYQFGTVKTGTVLSYEFQYTNKGKKDLIIHTVTASCGCTAANSNLKSIAPGKSGKISIRFDTSNKTGEQNKTITVVSNDPRNPRTILWLKGTLSQ